MCACSHLTPGAGRGSSEDRLIPDHVIAMEALDRLPIAEADRAGLRDDRLRVQKGQRIPSAEMTSRGAFWGARRCSETSARCISTCRWAQSPTWLAAPHYPVGSKPSFFGSILTAASISRTRRRALVERNLNYLQFRQARRHLRCGIVVAGGRIQRRVLDGAAERPSLQYVNFLFVERKRTKFASVCNSAGCSEMNSSSSSL